LWTVARVSIPKLSGVLLKVGASVGVGACGVDGTDEVWVAGVEETAIALMDFGHGGGVEVWAWV